MEIGRKLQICLESLGNLPIARSVDIIMFILNLEWINILNTPKQKNILNQFVGILMSEPRILKNKDLREIFVQTES